jgi:hypothetical protein
MDADVSTVIKFLEVKGRYLTSLSLTGRVTTKEPIDIVAIINKSCPNLKKLNLDEFLIPYELMYGKHELTLRWFSGSSLKQLIERFPRTRSFHIMSGCNIDPAVSDTWIQELKGFASMKRKRRIRADVTVCLDCKKESTVVESDDSNLLLTLRKF